MAGCPADQAPRCCLRVVFGGGRLAGGRLCERPGLPCSSWPRPAASSGTRARPLPPQKPSLLPQRPPASCRRSFLSLKIDEKKRMQESVSGHRTGLPPALLRHFEARPPLPPHKAPPAKPRKVPLSGVAQYLEHFAAPGDAEYEPPAPETRPPEPRVFVNPELPYQSRLDLETKLEK